MKNIVMQSFTYTFKLNTVFLIRLSFVNVNLICFMLCIQFAWKKKYLLQLGSWNCDVHWKKEKFIAITVFTWQLRCIEKENNNTNVCSFYDCLFVNKSIPVHYSRKKNRAHFYHNVHLKHTVEVTNKDSSTRLRNSHKKTNNHKGELNTQPLNKEQHIEIARIWLRRVKSEAVKRQQQKKLLILICTGLSGKCFISFWKTCTFESL